ncbi:MAG: hypothetical protein AB8B61_04330, partial [Cyclobacteriaceae bacterium]
FLFSSCDKEQETVIEASTNTQEIIDNTDSENEFNDLSSITREITDNATYTSSSSGRITALCHTITKNNANSNDLDTITIDFGTTGCDYYGRTRKGKIIFTYTDRHRNTGAVITTTLDNYYVDNTKVEGTREVKNQGPNVDGNLVFTVSVTGGKLTFSDSSTALWSSSGRTRTVDLQDTPEDKSDDIISVSGTTTNVSRTGVTRTSTVNTATPLVFYSTCKQEGGLIGKHRWIPVSGIKEVEIERTSGTFSRSIDFGDGSCDQKFEVTTSTGNTILIDLSK